MKYPVSPVLYSLLVTVTSENSTGSAPSLLSITIFTSAKPKDFLFCVPAKIMSSDLEPLSDFILCSPRTHLMASEILLFPEPFGPITAVIPFLNSNTVLSAKDLNPCISNFFKYIVFTFRFLILIYGTIHSLISSLSYNIHSGAFLLKTFQYIL